MKKINKNIIFIGGLAFLLLAGFLGFWYYRDTFFSKEVLKLEILGSETANVGDEVTYTVKYKNNGNFVLQNPKLIFQLPDNSLNEDSKTRFSQNLKDVYPGVEGIVTFTARLLGKEDEVKIARAWLSYTPKNLSVRYESDTIFITKIKTVPITLTFDMPLKIEKGKEVSYSVNYFSNIDYPLENLSVKINTAPGFNATSSLPTSLDNVEWKLETLQKAKGGRITVRGVATGDSGNNLNFSAQLGMWIDGIFVVIKQVDQDISIINPLLFISQQINHNSNYTAAPGEVLHYEIYLRNIGSSAFNDVFVQSDLEGFGFDFSTLKSDSGNVRPSDGLIIWDSKQVSVLQRINPQQEVKVTFDVKLKDSWVPSDEEKNNILLKNIVKVSDVSQEFSNKVSSRIGISQKAYYSGQQGFINIGPVPPEVNKSTTYTIVWQVKNYLNDLKNVKVRAVLPSNVSLVAVLPESQIPYFSLDSVSRQIVWLVGEAKAGIGVTSLSPTISFQVSLTPNFLQKGSPANLIGQVTISGEDQFTGNVISGTIAGLTTALPDDSAGFGGVVK